MAVAPPATAPALIGRGDDLAALEVALAHAGNGEPRAVLLAGDAGIGKTRLVAAFAERAAAGGAHVLAGTSMDVGDADLPYAAVMDALRGLPPEAYAELAPSLRRELGALMPEAAPDDRAFDGTQSGLFGAVLRLLEQLGGDAPVVLVLEDLHRADRSTQEIVAFLTRGLRRAAALLVLTYRTDELTRNQPARRLVAELRRAPRVEWRRLAPLTREETARQLVALAGGPVDADTVEAIHARSEGNPFFSEELLAARAGAGAVPPSLRDALLARLGRLPAAGQDVARLAAAFGRCVDHDVLAALAGLPDEALDDALRACVVEHVLVVDDDRRGYRFRHGLLQEVAAGELLPGERRRLHERIAELLEARPPAAGTAGAQRLAEIAHHRLLTHDAASGLVAAVRAARAAEDVHALAEASRNYDAALELWDAVPAAGELTGVDVAFLLERAAECRWLGLGDAVGSGRLLERALASLGPAAPALRRADLTSRLALTSWDAHAKAGAGVPLHEQALALVNGSEGEVAARVRARFANVLMLTGAFAAAERHAVEAVRVARAAGARREEADALITRFTCRAIAGDEPAARALLDEARAPMLETTDPRVVKRFFNNASEILYCFARYEDAIAIAREGIELHVRAGLSRHGRMCVHENAARALCALGRPEDAAELIGEEEAPFTSDTTCLHIRLSQVALLRGELDAAAGRLARTRAVLDAEPMILVPTCAAQADVALWRGDPATALAAVRAAETVLIDADRIVAADLLAVGIRAHADAAEAAAMGPDDARAAADRLLARLEGVAAAGDGPLPEPDARVRLGRAERTRLDAAPDPDAWAAVVAGWDALGRSYEAAYAGWRGAQAIAAARGPRDELAHVLAAAHERADAVGAAHLSDAIEALARRTRLALPGLAAPDGEPFPELTRREREVLALVADGRTNRQIAEALFITEKTASVHVSNILAKLGAANRGAAAALAHRAGFASERD
jgi:ATP/maltotriose-dependent transcriptional regulator MalT